MARVEISTEGKPIIILDGYEYHYKIKSIAGKMKYWVCSFKREFNARIVSNSNMEKIITVYKCTEHIHGETLST